jgi:tubulin beta
MTHAMGGGTGSGLGSLILDRIAEEYPRLISTTYSLFTGHEMGGQLSVGYNGVLAMSHFIE